MFLDSTGECDECGKTAFFPYENKMYCSRHSSLINDVDPDEVERLAATIEETGVQAEWWPMAYIAVDKIPWTVHEVSDENGYRVSEEGEYVLEPKNARVPFQSLEEFLNR